RSRSPPSSCIGAWNPAFRSSTTPRARVPLRTRKGMVAESSGSVYWEAILHEAPRILGMMDREAVSPTSGCGDRVFWAWKFVDFPGSRFQESLCVLAFLHATER